MRQKHPARTSHSGVMSPSSSLVVGDEARHDVLRKPAAREQPPRLRAARASRARRARGGPSRARARRRATPRRRPRPAPPASPARLEVGRDLEAPGAALAQRPRPVVREPLVVDVAELAAARDGRRGRRAADSRAPPGGPRARPRVRGARASMRAATSSGVGVGRGGSSTQNRSTLIGSSPAASSSLSNSSQRLSLVELMPRAFSAKSSGLVDWRERLLERDELLAPERHERLVEGLHAVGGVAARDDVAQLARALRDLDAFLHERRSTP